MFEPLYTAEEMRAVEAGHDVKQLMRLAAGAVVDATWTVTFHREKVGLYVAPGTLHRGELEVVDIGLQDRETVFARPTTEILDLVPLRSPGDTKYTAGSVLVVGGSPGLTG